MKITTTIDGVPVTTENEVYSTSIHRDRINRMISITRYGNGWRPAVHKWSLVRPREYNEMTPHASKSVEYHVWYERLASEEVFPNRGVCCVCYGVTESRSLTRHNEPTIYDTESRCTKCPWWHSGASQGYHEEQIGFVWFDWHGATVMEEMVGTRADEMTTAIYEIRAALNHPEFAAMVSNPEGAVIGILGDWLDDHGYAMQAAAAHGYEPTLLLPKHSQRSR